MPTICPAVFDPVLELFISKTFSSINLKRYVHCISFHLQIFETRLAETRLRCFLLSQFTMIGLITPGMQTLSASIKFKFCREFCSRIFLHRHEIFSQWENLFFKWLIAMEWDSAILRYGDWDCTASFT